MAKLVYFSNVSENTHRFVRKLGEDAIRIPVRPSDGVPEVGEPYVLITPTYGSGAEGKAIPRQTARFLNNPNNRAFIRGVIAAGNTNFGEDYCLAGRQIATKCGVPLLYRFELLGTPHDLEQVRTGLDAFWNQQ